MTSPAYEEFRERLFAGSREYHDDTTLFRGVPFWGDEPDSWDRVVLAGFEAPGLAKVTGKTKNRVERKTVPGTNGTTTTHIGYDPAEIKIELRIWTADQLQRLPDLIALIRPRRGAPVPVTINHPSTALYGIRSVLIIDAGFPERDDASDSYKMEIVGMEYVPSDKQKAKVETNKFDVSKIPQAFGQGVSSTVTFDKTKGGKDNPSSNNVKVPKP